MYIDTDLFVDFYGMPIPHASTGRFGDESWDRWSTDWSKNFAHTHTGRQTDSAPSISEYLHSKTGVPLTILISIMALVLCGAWFSNWSVVSNFHMRGCTWREPHEVSRNHVPYWANAIRHHQTPVWTTAFWTLCNLSVMKHSFSVWSSWCRWTTGLTRYYDITRYGDCDLYILGVHKIVMINKHWVDRSPR